MRFSGISWGLVDFMGIFMRMMTNGMCLEISCVTLGQSHHFFIRRLIQKRAISIARPLPEGMAFGIKLGDPTTGIQHIDLAEVWVKWCRNMDISENRGTPPNHHPLLGGVFHEINQAFYVDFPFVETPIY